MAAWCLLSAIHMNPAYVDLTAVGRDLPQADSGSHEGSRPRHGIRLSTNQTFAYLIAAQSLAGIAVAAWIAPHVWVAAVLVLVSVIPALGARAAVLAQTNRDAHRLAIELAEMTEQLRLTMEQVEAVADGKREFLANVSHELRTPLNAIMLYSQLLYDNAVEQQRVEDAADLAKIQTAGRRLLLMINRLVKLSRSEGNLVDVQLETFEMKAIVDELTGAALGS
jgi:signal transduction histidine kinase